jgi:hypothetical protein
VTGTVELTSGELLVDKSIIISGPGPEDLAVNGSAKRRVFHVSNDPCGNVTISGLTIVNGYTTGFGGGIHNDHAVLILNNCAITGNSAAGNIGGAIHNNAEYPDSALYATLEINNCSVTDNSGGGIYNNAEGGGVATVDITDSTLSNNNSGLAIYSHGWSCIFCGNGTAKVRIINSSITGNPGGAIYSDTDLEGGGVSLLSSTVSENSGVAIHISTLSNASVSNSTISGNSGGGIYNDVGSSGSNLSNSTISNNGTELTSYNGAFMTMRNTVFNVSSGGHSIVSDGLGTVKSIGYNLSSDDGGGYLTGPGDQINVNPLLGPLQDNGGPTFTHALLPSSPAINAGDPNFVPPPNYDQRGPGFDRVRNARIDIGSFEVQSPRRATPAPRSRPTPLPRPTPR